jgi:hypothetical protein
MSRIPGAKYKHKINEGFSFEPSKANSADVLRMFLPELNKNNINDNISKAIK